MWNKNYSHHSQKCTTHQKLKPTPKKHMAQSLHKTTTTTKTNIKYCKKVKIMINTE
jgi:hypothetical protein